MPTRRTFLSIIAGALATGAGPRLASRSPPDFDVLDLEVSGDKKLASRFTLFVPKHLAKGERVPLLVLLHGLAETSSPDVGVYAWVERYGLGTAYARLLRPPIVRTDARSKLLTDAHLAAWNAGLAKQPFRGMAIACPFTPNVGRQPKPGAALDAYADWIADVVVPRARKEAPMIIADAEHTALDGVSLGGYVAVETFVRRPSTFGALGGVQSAYKAARLPAYVEGIAKALTKAPKASVHLETSEADPFRKVNEEFAALLRKNGVATDQVTLPGLHDQPFLRESGTIEMLLWHDRRLRSG